MKAPNFWLRDGALARLLSPLGAAYDGLGRLRWALARPEAAGAPILCVGNATVGGTGKTPIVIDLLRRLRARGLDAHGLCRGHGGSLRCVVRVDPAQHGAAEVGDEALLIAGVAPTWAGRDRLAGARAAVAAGADVVVLDDGLQYPKLAKTAALLVVDGTTGFGNGHVIPAGPLRERLGRSLARAQAIVVVGAGEPPGLPASALPIWRACLEPVAEGRALAGCRAVAFAGIGRPEKFFATARAVGAELVATRAFPDHHVFRADELRELEMLAERAGARLLTTAKDAVRLPASLRAAVAVLEIEVAWEHEAPLARWLEKAVRWR